MSIIFTVSPVYLEAIFKESKQYNFDLQGYGSFKLACKGLLKTNCSDILGFVYAGIHLPSSKSKEFKYMLEFFDMIELMEANKKFVISSDESLAPWGKIFKKYKHIRFFKAAEHDFVSDIVINRQLFGSILLDTSKPYQLSKKHEEQMTWDYSKLEYVPMFSDAQIQCVTKVELLDTLERTLDNDEVFQRFQSEKAYLKEFRLYYIAILMNDTDTIIHCQNSINDILNSQQADTSNWCALVALKNYIEGNDHDN